MKGYSPFSPITLHFFDMLKAFFSRYEI